MEKNQLYHWGIKGMKWGVRRYQNKDGSLTPAGRKRYSGDRYADEAKNMTDQELRAKINRMNLEKRYYSMSTGGSGRNNAYNTADKGLNAASEAGKITKDALTLAGKGTKTMGNVNQGITGVRKTASAARKIDNTLNERKAVSKNSRRIEKMSDKDLADMVNRMDLERQYASLSSEKAARGKATVAKILDIAGDVLAVGASATVIAVNIYKARKGGGGGKITPMGNFTPFDRVTYT